MKDLYLKTLTEIEQENLISTIEIAESQILLDSFEHVVLSQGLKKISVLITTEHESFRVSILVEGDSDCHPSLFVKINNRAADWDVIGYTALLFIVANIDYSELQQALNILNKVCGIVSIRRERKKQQRHDIKLNLPIMFLANTS